MTISNTNGDGAPAPARMDERQFAEYMEKRLGLYEGEIEVLGRADMDLRLRVRGREVQVDLGNFYRAYRDNPAQLDAVVRTFVRVATGEAADHAEQDYNVLADRVFPMLKPINLLAEVRERRLPMLAYREFLADLIIAYVIDEGQSVAYVNEDHLERWGLPIQTLHEQAIENLRARTVERVDYVVAGEGEQRLFIFNSGDGYDASRLLLTDVLVEWARQLPGQLVVGIPNRDFLIAFSDADGEIMRNVAHQVQADSVQRPYGLTDQLFTVRSGQVREYEWE